jgi:hypothetical protein
VATSYWYFVNTTAEGGHHVTTTCHYATQHFARLPRVSEVTNSTFFCLVFSSLRRHHVFWQQCMLLDFTNVLDIFCVSGLLKMCFGDYNFFRLRVGIRNGGSAAYMKTEIYIQGIHKRMVRFQRWIQLISHHSFVYTLYIYSLQNAYFPTFRRCVLPSCTWSSRPRQVMLTQQYGVTCTAVRTSTLASYTKSTSQFSTTICRKWWMGKNI